MPDFEVQMFREEMAENNFDEDAFNIDLGGLGNEAEEQAIEENKNEIEEKIVEPA